MKEQIDVSTPAGKIMFTILGAIAEFERDIINERAHEGRERAKKQGKHMGPPGKSEKDIQRALKLYNGRIEKELTVQDIVIQTGVPKSTIYQKMRNTNEQEKLNK
ncbi:recombinase family protein [Halobacillus sp. A5]|nr:recombinase family protein [Halobacillus sp. A5]